MLFLWFISRIPTLSKLGTSGLIFILIFTVSVFCCNFLGYFPIDFLFVCLFCNHLIKKKISFLFSDCSFFKTSYFCFYVHNISINFCQVIKVLFKVLKALFGSLNSCCFAHGSYELNACVPPKAKCWNPNLQFDGIRRWNLWEVIRSWWWSPYRDPKSSLALFLLYEDTRR